MSFQDNKMLIMPAVDIKNGKCVQLVQGEPGTEQVIIENPYHLLCAILHARSCKVPSSSQ